ncbi:MAG TPA: hypothetical protein VHK24_13500 [Steroidobacter sp.]|nr:hypothetical protein [Steroidobacter sp.]
MRYQVPSPRLVAPIIVIALITVASPSRAASVHVAGVEAIWRVQSLPFEFRAPADVYYACESLHKKIRAILVAVGAHSQVIIQPECSPPAMINRASARITFASPVIASNENIRAATAFDSRRILLARAEKIVLPTAADVERFRAVWQPLSLVENINPRLKASDCELLRQLKEQVFPKIGVEVTYGKLHCSPLTRAPPILRVLALLPASA